MQYELDKEDISNIEALVMTGLTTAGDQMKV